MPGDPTSKPRWRPFQSIGVPSVAGTGRDIAAGLTLAAVALPEQMATARLGGFSPTTGLWAFVAASLGFAAFGAHRRLSAGADSTITPIFAGGLAAMATTAGAAYGPSAALLAIIVGVLVGLAGLLRLGWMADLLSKPVLTGFLAGISLHIVLSQAPTILGLPEESGTVYQRLAQLGAHIGATQPAALAIALGVFACVFLLEKVSPRIPGALVALAAAAALTAALRLPGVALLGRLAGGAPAFGVPVVSPASILPLLSLGFLTALVVMVQTAATSRAFCDPDADPDINRDYVGMGAAGILAGLIGAFPVDASPPRTGVVAAAGGNSQLCGLIAAALTALLVLFGAGLLAVTPAAALAGVLLFVAQRIFQVQVLARLVLVSKAEFLLAVLTALLVFAMPIQSGVAIGVFLSLAHGVFTTTRTRLIPFERQPGGTIWWPVSPSRHGERVAGVLVMGFQAPLSFLNAYAFRREVLDALSSAPQGLRLFVLEAGSLVEIDFTASEVFLEVIAEVRRRGVDFAMARMESVRAQAALDRYGVAQALGADHMFQSVDQAIRTLAPPAP